MQPLHRIGTLLCQLILTVLPVRLEAQDPYFIHYNVNNGLPSDEVYGIVFDQHKILWATTDRGVVRFDGYEFRSFTVSDGLKENCNLRIFNDVTHDRVFVSSLNNYLSYFQGDLVIKHPLSDTVHKLGGFSQYVQQIRCNRDGSIDLCFNRPGLFHLSPGLPPDTMTEHKRKYPESDLTIFYDPDGKSIWDMNRYPDDDENGTTSVIRDGNQFHLACDISRMNQNYRKDLHPVGPDEFLFAYGHKVFHIRGNQVVDELIYNNEVIDVFVDKQRNFWVGLMFEGAYKHPGTTLRSKPVHYLVNESVTGIEQDHEGNYWFSTANNGIFLARSLSSTIYVPEAIHEVHKHIMSVASDGTNVYFGSLSGKLYRASPGAHPSYSVVELPIPDSTGPLRRIVHTPDNHLFLFKDHILLTDMEGNPAGFRRIPRFGYDGVRFPDGTFLITFINSGEIIRDNQLFDSINPDSVKSRYPNFKKAEIVTNRVRSILLDKNNRLWLGSQDGGVFSTDGRNLISWADKIPLLGLRTRDIIQVKDDIWFSIADFGILILHPDSTYTRIMKKGNLSSDIVDVLYAENDSTVWAGTGEGLNRIRIKRKSTVKYEIDHFTQQEGLPSNRVYDITSHRGAIWVASSQGLICLDPDFQKPLEIEPVLQINSVEVNGEPRNPDHVIRLRSHENSLVFHYKAITYRKKGSVRYWCKLDGVDENWVKTENIEARYPDLKSGRYTFRLVASYKDDFEEEASLSIPFRIRKKWFETNLFLFLAVFIILVVIGIIFRIRINILKRQENQKLQLLEAEKRALLSQMNPHFIFNSLNSIQHFIVERDEFNANNYLTNFSSLIRRILDNSRKNLIPLTEEIETLELYLGMEKLRFDDNFDYKILKDPGLDYNELMIPPMLIQPIVENAIWHGLTPLKTSGLLEISFNRCQDHFSCQVRDNGIGREKALILKGKRNDHESTGFKNVQERINLLNLMNDGKIELSVLDLKNPDGSSSGTSVVIMLPMSWGWIGERNG